MLKKNFILILIVFIFMLIVSPLNAREKYQLADTWGNPYGFSKLSAIAIDNNENIYVVDAEKCQVRKFTPEGELICIWGGWGFKKGLLRDPKGIAIDSNNDIYVADYRNNRIQKFTSDGKFICLWGRKGDEEGRLNRPSDIVVDEDYVYVADSRNWRVCKFTTKGKLVSDWETNIDKSNHTRVALDNDGYVYVRVYDDIYKFYKYTPSGEFVSECKGYEYEKLFLYKEKNGNLYTINTNKIQKFTLNVELIFEWKNKGTGDGEFSSPSAIAVNDNGDVYVIDSPYWVQKFTSEGEFICKWGGRGDGDGEFNNPGGIAVDDNGDLYVADTNNSRICKFTSDGEFISQWEVKGNGDNEFSSPMDMAVDKDGNVYVIDRRNESIYKFTSDGEFITKWRSSYREEGIFYEPTDIAIDYDGNIYVAYEKDHRIQKFTSDGKFLSKWTSQGLRHDSHLYASDWIGGTGPCSIAVHNNIVYVSDSGFRQIHMFTSKGISLGKIKTRVKYPYAGIAVDADGNIYAADTYNICIRVFQPVP